MHHVCSWDDLARYVLYVPHRFLQKILMLLPSIKELVIGFKTGRKVAYLQTSNGLFVEVVGQPHKDEVLKLPADAAFKSSSIDNPLVISLPTRTTAYFRF